MATGPDPGGPERPRFLVTAGSTRERIDSVRDWGNVFTGNTGLAIARALADVGEVDLLTSNRNHLSALAETGGAAAGGPDRHPIHASPFTTHEQLKGTLSVAMARNRYAAVFMTAAVADYRPTRVYEVLERRAEEGRGEERWVVRDVQAAKVKSSFASIAVVGERTQKLVDLFRTEWGHRGLLVKFKLEVGISKGELLSVGEASRVASSADFLVANTLEMVGGPEAGAYLLGAAGHEWVPRAELPRRMVKLVQARQ
jgi:phosphopantothenoylcysteine synthetase/decarboxylase